MRFLKPRINLTLKCLRMKIGSTLWYLSILQTAIFRFHWYHTLLTKFLCDRMGAVQDYYMLDATNTIVTFEWFWQIDTRKTVHASDKKCDEQGHGNDLHPWGSSGKILIRKATEILQTFLILKLKSSALLRVSYTEQSKCRFNMIQMTMTEPIQVSSDRCWTNQEFPWLEFLNPSTLPWNPLYLSVFERSKYSSRSQPSTNS